MFKLFLASPYLFIYLFIYFQAMDGVRGCQSSDVLTEAEEVSAFLLELGHYFHEWRFALPDVLILLQVNAFFW